MRDALPRFRPVKILRALEEHGVRYVVIGNLGAVLHGSSAFTGDLDICPARDPDNLARLADALRGLRPRLRDEVDLFDPVGERPMRCEAGFLEQATTLNLATRFGDLDLVFVPDGTRGHDDLAAGAVRYELAEGLNVSVASLADIIRSKGAADREKDRAALPALRALLAKSQE